MNDLDKELKVLTATHNTLQTEATKKGAALEKTSFYVTTLRQDNDKLQEVHEHVRQLSACLISHFPIVLKMECRNLDCTVENQFGKEFDKYINYTIALLFFAHIIIQLFVYPSFID